jgi:hypothetical protein
VRALGVPGSGKLCCGAAAKANDSWNLLHTDSLLSFLLSSLLWIDSRLEGIVLPPLVNYRPYPVASPWELFLRLCDTYLPYLGRPFCLTTNSNFGHLKII